MTPSLSIGSGSFVSVGSASPTYTTNADDAAVDGSYYGTPNFVHTFTWTPESSGWVYLNWPDGPAYGPDFYSYAYLYAGTIKGTDYPDPASTNPYTGPNPAAQGLSGLSDGPGTEPVLVNGPGWVQAGQPYTVVLPVGDDTAGHEYSLLGIYQSLQALGGISPVAPGTGPLALRGNTLVSPNSPTIEWNVTFGIGGDFGTRFRQMLVHHPGDLRPSVLSDKTLKADLYLPPGAHVGPLILGIAPDLDDLTAAIGSAPGFIAEFSLISYDGNNALVVNNGAFATDLSLGAGNEYNMDMLNWAAPQTHVGSDFVIPVAAPWRVVYTPGGPLSAELHVILF